MKIAILGSGIAGLSACWYLSKEHDVILIERHSLPGMDAHGTDVSLKDGVFRFDVPFRAFKQNYYPCLIEMYNEAGIEFRPVDYSFSLSERDGTTYFQFATIGLGGNFYPFVSPVCFKNGESRKIFSDTIRFYVESEKQFEFLRGEQLTISGFLQRFGYSKEFENKYLIPMFATINTCTIQSTKNYPAEAVIRYHSKGLKFLRFLTASHGTRDITEKLSIGAKELRLKTNPRKIEQNGKKVFVSFDDGKEEFDRVIIATPANQAISLLPDEMASEKELLSSFRYEESEILMHTDPSFMPNKKRHWAPLCFTLSPETDKPSATIRLNKVLPEIGKTEIFQTWNPLEEPKQGTLISRSRFERPIIDLKNQKTVEELKALQERPGRKIWFCGSYARYGIPLLEAGVSTSLDIKRWVENSERF
ncbi:NAD(P)-binding protein [Leptospira noguchii]|uniref:NAD(P)-binding Rossmann-like domain protein n=1 Tax=Leptospira noguchii str. 2007001578 TaxID=1049974 RepID=A0ABN0J7A1_9LEPT|nr:NAD(P)-binding protein [Leptospira noguchii]EMN02913.1 NAD(P)-binding Rossmann-like domain protein [Leptospira noguchii str. 2007001578]